MRAQRLETPPTQGPGLGTEFLVRSVELVTDRTALSVCCEDLVDCVCHTQPRAQAPLSGGSGELCWCRAGSLGNTAGQCSSPLPSPSFL